MRARPRADSAWRRWPSVIMLRRLREPPLEGFCLPPRRQRRSAASIQTVSSGASTLKQEQTSRVENLPKL